MQKRLLNYLYTGNAKAVLGGDYLLSEAFALLKAFDREYMNKAIDVVKEMTLVLQSGAIKKKSVCKPFYEPQGSAFKVRHR